MHARGRGGRGMHVPRAFKSGVSLGSKRLTLVPLGACARRCRFRSHNTPSTQASVVASASSAASGRPETAISVSLLARSHDLPFGDGRLGARQESVKKVSRKCQESTAGKIKTQREWARNGVSQARESSGTSYLSWAEPGGAQRRSGAAQWLP